jgi:hemerythrin-like domain-containing protein
LRQVSDGPKGWRADADVPAAAVALDLPQPAPRANVTVSIIGFRARFPVSHAALDVIRSEHSALAAMLQSLTMLLAQSRREGAMPDFAVLRAMLLYVDEFPERLHHRKESDLLFPRVRARVPALGAVLDRLEQDHEQGERAIRELSHLLLAFEVMGESRRDGFEAAYARFAQRYHEHMRTEEREVLPAAQAHLAPADWAELDAAFLANRDPLTGHEPEDGYKALFHRIAMSAKAPIGFA